LPPWCRRFPGVGAIDDRPRITIHKENMQAAAETIINHVKPTSRLEELITLLQAKLEDKQHRIYHSPNGGLSGG